MLFGITGAAGTGKTTLAKQVAEDLDIKFQATSISECAKRHGFDAVAPMRLTDRIKLQYHLLEDHLEMIDGETRPLIVDRTPIDFIGYMLCEVTMHSHLLLEAEHVSLIENYVDMCQQAAIRHYDYIFVLGKLDGYEIAPTRPADNRAYQSHTQLVMIGALAQMDCAVNYSILNTVDPTERRDHVHDTIIARMDAIDRERKSSAHIH